MGGLAHFFGELASALQLTGTLPELLKDHVAPDALEDGLGIGLGVGVCRKRRHGGLPAGWRPSTQAPPAERARRSQGQKASVPGCLRTSGHLRGRSGRLRGGGRVAHRPLGRRGRRIHRRRLSGNVKGRDLVIALVRRDKGVVVGRHLVLPRLAVRLDIAVAQNRGTGCLVDGGWRGLRRGAQPEMKTQPRALMRRQQARRATPRQEKA